MPRKWRGIGAIPASGLGLRERLSRDFDAERASASPTRHVDEPERVHAAASILQGLKKPPECPAFGTRCTPEHPLGATMVSSEGACAAYYRYRRLRRGWREGELTCMIWRPHRTSLPGADCADARTCSWRTAAAAV